MGTFRDERSLFSLSFPLFPDKEGNHFNLSSKLSEGRYFLGVTTFGICLQPLSFITTFETLRLVVIFSVTLHHWRFQQKFILITAQLASHAD